MWNGSLWSNVVFEEGVISQTVNDFMIMQLNAFYYKSESNAIKVFFFSLFSCKFDEQLSQNFNRFVLIWSVIQLPKLSSAFKPSTHTDEVTGTVYTVFVLYTRALCQGQDTAQISQSNKEVRGVFPLLETLDLMKM